MGDIKDLPVGIDKTIFKPYEIKSNVTSHESGCYVIFCDKTEKYYVGSSRYCGERRWGHFKALMTNTHQNKSLQEDYNKFGEAAFHFVFIQSCEHKNLLSCEAIWFDKIGQHRLYNKNRINKGMNIVSGQTISELCEQDERRIEAVRVQWGRTIKRDTGRTFARDYVPTAEEWVRLAPKMSANKTKKRNISSTIVQPKPAARNAVSPEVLARPKWQMPEASEIRRFALDALLIVIAAGHAILIWYDCFTLWGTPGLIGGGLAFGIVLATIMLATDPTKNVTSQYALLFALVVDAGAFWVHYPVFSEYDAPEGVTAALCVFLCAMSWGSLFLYRHQKNN